MGRAPCCDKGNVKRGPWSPEEDAKLKEYIENHGNGGNWIALPQKAGLKRCGKSCRLRWLNYLRPNIKRGEFSREEDMIICSLYASIGSRWSIIAAQLRGRTDNDVKNYWNTKLKRKLMKNIFPSLLPNQHLQAPNCPSLHHYYNQSPSSSLSFASPASLSYTCNYGSPTNVSYSPAPSYTNFLSSSSSSNINSSCIGAAGSLLGVMQQHQASCSSLNSDGSSTNQTVDCGELKYDHDHQQIMGMNSMRYFSGRVDESNYYQKLMGSSSRCDFSSSNIECEGSVLDYGLEDIQ